MWVRFNVPLNGTFSRKAILQIIQEHATWFMFDTDYNIPDTHAVLQLLYPCSNTHRSPLLVCSNALTHDSEH